MTDELDVVRRARPVAAAPGPAVEDAARRSLMAVIAQSADAPAPARPRRRMTRRRRAALVLVPLLAIGAGATAWAGYLGWGVSPDSRQYRDAIAAAQARTPLPPGHRWSMAPIPAREADGTGVMVGLNGAPIRVAMNAMCHWESAWVDAIRAGDAAGRARSDAAYASLVASIPLHRDGQAEDVAGADANSFAWWARIRASARRGETGMLLRDMSLNCPAETRQPTAW